MTLTLAQDKSTALPEDLRGTAGKIDAVYVHVPFCTTKCHYCDFYSVAGHLDRAPLFLEALRHEIDLQIAFWGAPRPRTVFIGGGTPTLLPADLLQQLLELLRSRLDLTALEEFTVEANPNTFDAEKAALLAAGGVNRVSFGAQSFHARELAMLQRDHDPESARTAFALARQAGLHNLNLDLIFGIPGQTLDSWEQSLARALDLQPAHMSCYALIYEPNTAMTARLHRGDFLKIDEETELALFEHVYHRLRKAGFTRYETSNYARSAVCRHNLIYWQAGNWLGLGPGAGSHMALPDLLAPPDKPVAWQWKNTGSLAHYLDALPPRETREGRGHLPITQMEPLARIHWAAGAAIFWLRLDEGLNYGAFARRTHVDVQAALEKVLSPFAAQGLVELTPDAARITERGVAVSDHILKRVLPALEALPLRPH